MILRKSNKWRHERSDRHSVAVALVDRERNYNSNIENIIRSMRRTQQIPSPRCAESSNNSIATDSFSAPSEHYYPQSSDGNVSQYNDRFSVNSNYYSHVKYQQ